VATTLSILAGIGARDWTMSRKGESETVMNDFGNGENEQVRGRHSEC
jgi:hypothetical protein